MRYNLRHSLTLAGLGLCLACHPLNRAAWLVTAPRAVEQRFGLPDSSVTFDTVREWRDTSIVPGDPSAYVVIVHDGGPARTDTLHDPRRLDDRPDLRVWFRWPAVSRLGYVEGRVHSFEPFAKEVWRHVPADIAVRTLAILFQCGDEGCDGRVYSADSLDALWPRRP